MEVGEVRGRAGSTEQGSQSVNGFRSGMKFVDVFYFILLSSVVGSGVGVGVDIGRFRAYGAGDSCCFVCFLLLFSNCEVVFSLWCVCLFPPPHSFINAFVFFSLGQEWSGD